MEDIPLEAPAADAKLLRLQQESTDYFAFWRASRARKWRQAEREAVYKAAAHPRAKPTKWPGHDFAKQNTRRPTTYMNDGNPFSTLSRRGMQAEAALRAYNPLLKSARVHKRKLLGWGGLGVVGLYSVEDENGDRKDVVIKLNLDEVKTNHLKYEIGHHVLTAGAKHIVQQIVLPLPAVPQAERPPAPTPAAAVVAPPASRVAETSQGGQTKPPPPAPGLLIADPNQRAQPANTNLVLGFKQRWTNFRNTILPPNLTQKPKFPAAEVRTARRDINRSDFILVMEYLCRGDLETCLQKMGGSRMWFSNKVLWRIFDCFVRAAIGMAYPRQFYDGHDPWTQDVPQVDETCPGVEPTKPLVHFDIDPQNVLIGDFDGNDHNCLPIFKVGDLGLAEHISEAFKDSATQLWSSRRRGKSFIFTPEQFTDEWDWVETKPNINNKETTAGNYGSAMNIYQLGLTMWSLITICRPREPPACKEIEVTAPWGKETLTTYGAELLEPLRYRYADQELRILVAKCLSHRPSSRPGLAWLQERIKQRFEKGFAETDAQTQRWSHGFFGGPPPPPRAQAVDEWVLL